jgi:hypothetical protein
MLVLTLRRMLVGSLPRRSMLVSLIWSRSVLVMASVFTGGVLVERRHQRRSMEPRARLTERKADHGNRHQQSRKAMHEALHVFEA